MMQSNPNCPSPDGSDSDVSENRLRLLLLCALALALMLATVYGTVGLGPTWARFAAPAA